MFAADSVLSGQRDDRFAVEVGPLAAGAAALADVKLQPGAVRARITRARELLATTTMSVTQVAATLGYPDVASFSRQYKWHTGRSPGRRRHQPP